MTWPDFGVATAAALVILVLATLTWQRAKRSLVVRSRLAVAGVLTILALTLLTDWPNETANAFWRDHALVSGVTTSLLLVGAGLVLVDTRAQREEERRSERILQLAITHVQSATGATRLLNLIGDVTSITLKRFQLYMVDNDLDAWMTEMDQALELAAEGFRDIAGYLMLTGDPRCLVVAERLLKARVATRSVLPAHPSLDFHPLVEELNWIRDNLVRVNLDPSDEAVFASELRRLERKRRVDLVRRLLRRQPLDHVKRAHLRSELRVVSGYLLASFGRRAMVWLATSKRPLEAIGQRISDVFHNSDYLRLPDNEHTRAPSGVTSRGLTRPLQSLAWSGAERPDNLPFLLRAIPRDVTLEFIDALARGLGAENDYFNEIALDLGLAEHFPRNDLLLGIPVTLDRVQRIPNPKRDVEIVVCSGESPGTVVASRRTNERRMRETQRLAPRRSMRPAGP